MSPKGKQVRNGKSFEYALASYYVSRVSAMGLSAVLVEDEPLDVARGYYLGQPEEERRHYDGAAAATWGTMVEIEPALTTQVDGDDVLYVAINGDAAGEEGDVRDVVFRRERPKWETGFSAKNNNDAMKHSRLGHKLDFGRSWLGTPCSGEYWEEVSPVFDRLDGLARGGATWQSLGSCKASEVYVPLLRAFRDEIMRLDARCGGVPGRLVEYLIGNKPFYKVIKDDAHNLVVVKAFNIGGGLNRSRAAARPRCTTPRVNMPERIVEFDFCPGSSTTLDMIMDKGWEISFRLHSASTMVERSLKFDIQLLGNPPVLFTQHVFQ